MQEATPLKYFNIKLYIDSQGKEVEELECIQDGTKRYAVILMLPIPFNFGGKIMVIPQRSRYIVKTATNVADAFNQHDKVQQDVEKEYNDMLTKPKVEIAKSI